MSKSKKPKPRLLRTHSIQIMVTEDQKNIISTAAAKKGLSASTWAFMELMPIAETIAREK